MSTSGYGPDTYSQPVRDCKQIKSGIHRPYSMTHRQLNAIKTSRITSFFKRELNGHGYQVIKGDNQGESETDENAHDY